MTCDSIEAQDMRTRTTQQGAPPPRKQPHPPPLSSKGGHDTTKRGGRRGWPRAAPPPCCSPPRSPLAATRRFQWWLFDFVVDGATYPAVVARGWGGQSIAVFPAERLVVVQTGGNYRGADPADAVLSEFVLEALGN